MLKIIPFFDSTKKTNAMTNLEEKYIKNKVNIYCIPFIIKAGIQLRGRYEVCNTVILPFIPYKLTVKQCKTAYKN